MLTHVYPITNAFDSIYFEIESQYCKLPVELRKSFGKDDMAHIIALTTLCIEDHIGNLVINEMSYCVDQQLPTPIEQLVKQYLVEQLAEVGEHSVTESRELIDSVIDATEISQVDISRFLCTITYKVQTLCTKNHWQLLVISVVSSDLWVRFIGDYRIHSWEMSHDDVSYRTKFDQFSTVYESALRRYYSEITTY